MRRLPAPPEPARPFTRAGFFVPIRLSPPGSRQLTPRLERMNPTTVSAPCLNAQLTDIVGLRTCGIFPKDHEPSIRTLREWTRLRRLPHHRVGHFVYYDPAEVAVHIRTKLKIPARG